MTREDELQAKVATLKDAIEPILAELAKLPKTEAVASQVFAWQQKGQQLNAEIARLNTEVARLQGELDQAQKQIRHLLSQTKEGRLAQLKAQQEKLAKVIAAEETPPPEEKQPDETKEPMVAEEVK